MPEFDLHVAIKELANWAIEHPCCQGRGLAHCSSLVEVAGVWTDCGGTGHYAPFASLRVECWHGKYIQQFACWPCTEGCDHCGGRGWIPEPDVEKAEYAALRVLARYDLKRAQGVLSDIGAIGLRGLPIRAAQAWLKEERGLAFITRTTRATTKSSSLRRSRAAAK